MVFNFFNKQKKHFMNRERSSHDIEKIQIKLYAYICDKCGNENLDRISKNQKTVICPHCNLEQKVEKQYVNKC